MRCTSISFNKKNVLVKLKGYRNFKQAQDYDLWLRLLSEGYKITFIDLPLIRYRIRENSISQSKTLLQFLTSEYQKKLYEERKHNGNDSFNENHFYTYLKKNKAFDLEKNKRFNQACIFLNRGLSRIKSLNIIGVLDITKAFCCDYRCIKKLLITLKYRKVVSR